MRVAVQEIERISRRALLAHGASETAASHVARAVARAEATGNVICGLYYLESYCLALASGRVDGSAAPEVHRPRPGQILVDARAGFAQPAFAAGLPIALTAARETGVATLAIGHSHTCTSLGFFTEQIAGEGLIGIGMTNASAIVAPPGGRTPILGTNPIAFSLPGGPDGPAMHADFSTSAVALGKITMARAAGEAIPEGWATDADGRATTDPAAALGGALASAAGPKGWAIGLLVEFLAAGLTGSVNSLDVKGLKLPDGPPHDLGQFYILIDPGPMGGPLADRIGRVAAAVAEDGGGRIPGRHRQGRSEAEVPDALWSAALRLAGEETPGQA